MLNFPDIPTLGQEFTGGGSSWTWDGVKWEATTTSDATTIVTPVSGDTIVLTSRAPLYVNNSSVLAALTIRLPPEPSPRQFAQIGFRNPVTVLTVQDSAGVVLTGEPDSAYGPGAAIIMYYLDHSIKWILWK